VKKFRKIRKFMCGKESFLVFNYFLGFFHSFVLFFSFFHCMCVILGKLICVKKKKVVFSSVFFIITNNSYG
jgi:hypothetical protein